MGIHMIAPLYEMVIKPVPAPPTTITLYTQPHPEVSSVDGGVLRWGVAESWATIRVGAGVLAYPSADLCYVEFTTGYTSNTWQILNRIILDWDGTPIPAGKTILSAKVRAYCSLKTLIGSLVPQYNIFQSNPASNINLVPADFQTFQAVPLSDSPIDYDDIVAGTWLEWDLNAAGLALINSGPIPLGIREQYYDAEGNAPAWVRYDTVVVEFHMAEYSDDHRPQLVVTYR